MMLVLAHRGYSGKAPENTMSAFELALEVGAHGLELDVHLTKDGEVIVIHDHLLDRTTNGTGLVEAHTLTELLQLDAGSWFGAEFKGEGLPTLEDVCRLVQTKDVLFNVELKTALGFEGLVDKVAALLKKYDLEEKTIISSFNHYALAYFKEVKPHIKTGILYMAGLYNPWVYAQSIGAGALHAYHETIVPEIVAECQQNGMMVNPWTIDDSSRMEQMLAAKVDAIITNEPKKALDLI